jgi:hypothetical protein
VGFERIAAIKNGRESKEGKRKKKKGNTSIWYKILKNK